MDRHLIPESCASDVQHEILEADQLPQLRNDWLILEASATGFQTYDWCHAWVKAAGEAGSPESVRILVQRVAGKVALIWPMAIRQLGPCLILHTLGEPATQYSEVLIRDDPQGQELLALAWAAISSWKGIDAIELRRVRQTSKLSQLEALRRFEAPGSLEAAPYVDVSGKAGGSAIGQRTGRSRNALRRHERLLSEHGEVRFEILRGPEDQLGACREARILKDSWRARKMIVTAGYAHPASQGFLESLAAQGQLCGARLRVGEDTAAIEIGMVRNGVYLSLVQSYDERFSRHAPGRILFWRFLDECPKLGITVFDFLAPATRHKQEWSEGAVATRDYFVPISRRGRVAAYYLSHTKPALKRIYLRLPGWGKKIAERSLLRLS